jgi:hypothetical protein
MLRCNVNREDASTQHWPETFRTKMPQCSMPFWGLAH